MSLTQTIISGCIAVVMGLLLTSNDPGSPRAKARHWLLYLLSLLAVFWLQPSLPIRYLDFWLPVATLALTTLSWVLTAPREMRISRKNLGAVITLISVVVCLGATRWLTEPLLLSSRPPQTMQIIFSVFVVSIFAFLVNRFWRPFLLGAFIVLLLFILVVLKTPALSETLSAFLRSLNGQAMVLASPLDIRWLGFSYIAFRLIHTLRDRQAGRLPPVALSEYLTYVIFFPSLTAGPIDRVERFVKDLRNPLALESQDWLESGTRFFTGMFKKYVVADSLALIALNTTNALQVRTAGWAWVLLYAYSLQIFFDFSGYTDIVIGIAHPLGIRLPENFNKPYLKPNLTQFWNSWHMTLTQWFRSYYFNPLTRAMRTSRRPWPFWAIILISQVSTMVLIGLWHGITWNFALWGLYQGLGLFVHNRWSEFVRPRWPFLSSPVLERLLRWGGVFVTFNFVAIGWVFFSLPAIETSRRFMAVLFGLT